MSFGGSTSQETAIPEYITEAAKKNLERAELVSNIGYIPYIGPDVAAFSPMQEAGFQSTENLANAFGMGSGMSQQDIMGGMGEPTQYANGVRGYSSYPLYEEALEELAKQRAGQKQYIDSLFIDPFTGAMSSNALLNQSTLNPQAVSEEQRVADFVQMRRESRSDANKAAMQSNLNDMVEERKNMPISDFKLPSVGGIAKDIFKELKGIKK
mgnify:CR=1 FL=1|tara:strand:+ start:392 stop:1024 length:633 start_codon:yes stop_codon:yes gene_type:complete